LIRAAVVVLALVAIIGVASPARADDQLQGASPLALPLVPAGHYRADLSVEYSLTLREVGEPASVAPDIYLGLPHGLTIGLYHSTRAAGLLSSGSGLCLRSEDAGCVEPYSGTGLDLLRPMVDDRGFALAARLRFDITRYTEPFKPRLATGLAGSFRWRAFAIATDPHLAFGLTNQDRGNPITVNLPLWIGGYLGPADIFVRSGFYGPVRGFADSFFIPMGLGTGVTFGRLRTEIFAVLPKIGGPLNTPRHRDLLLRFSLLI
jgi:hypothetical protein